MSAYTVQEGVQQPAYNSYPGQQQQFQMQQPPQQVVMARPSVAANFHQDNGCDYPRGALTRIPLANQYSTDLCECCDPTAGGSCEHCCYGMWCAPCMFGQNICMLDRRDPKAQQNGMTCGIGYFAGQAASMFGFPLHWAFGMMGRSKINSHFAITSENDLQTCCTHLWCSPCAICQERREIWIRQNVNGNMNMPPPPPYMNMYPPHPDASVVIVQAGGMPMGQVMQQQEGVPRCNQQQQQPMQREEGAAYPVQHQQLSYNNSI